LAHAGLTASSGLGAVRYLRGMDEAFRLIATQIPRTRRFSPFVIRTAAVLSIIVTLVVTFGMFVNGQQHAADARRATMAAQQAEDRAAAARAAAEAAAASPSAIVPSEGVVNGMLNTSARDAANTALGTAMQVAKTTSLDRVVPTALSAVNHELLFIDGPSKGPSIVSVFAGATAWAAAVRGSGDTCYWVALAAGGQARYGVGSPCTGIAALAADQPGW
jgi:hypothetical protein